ncbi:MAG: hypothetical protein O7B99_10735 [Planctomycetota bacterium]|nr:hypothetical protein [Planctomycetota bacterium]
MPRVAAWTCLREGSKMPLREVDRVARARGLDDRDRAMVRALVGTEVRRRATLRALVSYFARGRPPADLTAHMRLGLVQLYFFDRVPDHAAVSTTVGATADTLGRSKGRYVNAVLRAAIAARREGKSDDPRRDLIGLVGRDLHLAEQVFRDPVTHPLLWAEDALSIPSNLMRRWEQRYGFARACELGRTFLVEPALSVRVVGVARASAADELASADPRPAAHPDMLVCASDRTAAVTGSAAFAEGRVTIQGATALAAAELVGASEGERVLDLCTSPGGKTAVLAGSGARVVAVENDLGRIGRLRETLERLRVADRVQIVAADARMLFKGGSFDAVLVDAPCSNTGVLGARPGARWRFGPRNLASLVSLQEGLLAAGAARVRPGGRLVWSTCSLEPEENGQLVRRFVAEHSGWTLVEEQEALPAASPAPHPIGPTDGGYAALLKRG